MMTLKKLLLFLSILKFLVRTVPKSWTNRVVLPGAPAYRRPPRKLASFDGAGGNGARGGSRGVGARRATGSRVIENGHKVARWNLKSIKYSTTGLDFYRRERIPR